MTMSDGLFVRITQGHNEGRSGIVVSAHGHFATVRLTSTGLSVVVPRRWLRFETLTPVSVSEWRAREAGG